MKILVCGSRDFPRPSLLIRAMLDGLTGDCIPTPEILEGGCPTGADAEARDWADEHPDVTITTFYADWKTSGRAAGPMRNQVMLDEEPDLVLAFVNKPLEISRGTADMVRRARRAGIPTLVCEFTQGRA